MRYLHRLILLVLPVVILISCGGSDPNAFTIKGTVVGEVGDSTLVSLKYVDSVGDVQTESNAVIKSNRFEIKGSAWEKPGLGYLEVQGMPGRIPLFMEPGKIEARINKDSIPLATVEGTLQNNYLSIYKEVVTEMGKAKQSISSDWAEAIRKRDSVTMGSLREEYQQLLNEEAEAQKDFMRKHPDALISAYTMGDMLAAKVVPNREVLELYNGLSIEVRESKQAQNMKKILDERLKTDVGSVAPPFSGPNPDGKTISLDDLRGKLVLVDFWAAWCVPCRAENPNVVSVYQKYKDRGFTVLGVSLDTDAEKWKSAIREDGLVWDQVSHLMRFQDPIAMEYNIKAIPASFLVDENGVIVARNLRGPELEEKVSEILEN